VPRLPRPRLTVAVAATVLAVAPLLLFALSPHLPGGTAMKYFQNNTYVPIGSPALVATAGDTGAVALSWSRPSTPGIGVWFKVMRSSREPLYCFTVAGATTDCAYIPEVETLTMTRDTSYTDRRLPGGGGTPSASWRTGWTTRRRATCC